jgi:hypothetical protein
LKKTIVSLVVLLAGCSSPNGITASENFSTTDLDTISYSVWAWETALDTDLEFEIVSQKHATIRPFSDIPRNIRKRIGNQTGVTIDGSVVYLKEGQCGVTCVMHEIGHLFGIGHGIDPLMYGTEDGPYIGWDLINAVCGSIECGPEATPMEMILDSDNRFLEMVVIKDTQ